jgi:Zn-dependent peptidase ImmA (M78 family)/DNA-binding XRE family transcriptional regulator
MNTISILDKIDPRALGARLKQARMSADVTQETAAKRIGAARTTIVAIERGDRRLSGEEFLALCDLYRASPGRVLRSDSLSVDLSPQFRRLPTGAADTQGMEVTRVLQDAATRYVELERKLGRPLQPDYPPPRRIQRGQVAEQAEDAAAELRSRLGLGQSPIMDLLGLIDAELRIRLFVLPLPAQVSGAYAYHEALDACILINANHARTRQVWTAAHELGHFLTDRGTVEVLRVDAAVEDPSEQFANRFAAALLMPASAVRSRFRDMVASQGVFSARALVYLAMAFHVSPEAAARRLEQLRLFKKGTYQVLRSSGFTAAVAREIAGESAEPQGPPVLLPRYTEIALEAFEEELISEGELAGMLRLGRIETREFLDSLAALADAVEEERYQGGPNAETEARNAPI